MNRSGFLAYHNSTCSQANVTTMPATATIARSSARDTWRKIPRPRDVATAFPTACWSHHTCGLRYPFRCESAGFTLRFTFTRSLLVVGMCSRYACGCLWGIFPMTYLIAKVIKRTPYKKTHA